MNRTIRLLLGVVPVLSSAAVAATLNVPASFPTIQSAINAAAANDTVLVAPGAYHEKIDFKGKQIKVMSASGAAVTTIDATGLNGSVVTFKTGENNKSILFGFTVTGGTGTVSGTKSFGGGIYCVGASPTIQQNLIKSNTAKGSFLTPGGEGGGIYVNGGSPRILENTILLNQAQNDGGGIQLLSAGATLIQNNTLQTNVCAAGTGAGINSTSSAPVIRGNMIIQNLLASTGGGINADGGSSLLIEDNEIVNNVSNIDGGGIYCDGGTATIRRNIVSDNNAGILFACGGGISCRNNSPSVSQNVISGNRIIGDGGGASFENGSPTIVDNIIVANRAEGDFGLGVGGGIVLTNATATVTNNTIADNVAFAPGGGVALRSMASMTMTNCIVWGNTASSDPAITGFAGSVAYSDVQGGFSGAGNFAADPLFVDAPNGDYHLSVDSPCFDAGTTLAPALPLVDFEGDDRVHYDGVDMGADEISGCVIRGFPYGHGLVGTGGKLPSLSLTGHSCEAGGHTLHIDDVLGGVYSNLWIGTAPASIPFLGGLFYIDLSQPYALVPFFMPASGSLALPGANVTAFAGFTIYLQGTFADPGGPAGASMTNGLRIEIGE